MPDAAHPSPGTVSVPGPAPDRAPVVRVPYGIPIARQPKSAKFIDALFARVKKTVALADAPLMNPFWGPYPHVVRSRFAVTPAGPADHVPLQVASGRGPTSTWTEKSRTTLEEELHERLLRTSGRRLAEIYDHIRAGRTEPLAGLVSAAPEARSRLHKLSLLHVAVLLAPEAARDEIVSRLLAGGVPDGVDSYGATARMRARQLGMPFDGHEVRSALPNVSLFTPDGAEIRYTTEEQFVEALYASYPQRERDLSYSPVGCDPDLVYFLYLHGPADPQVDLANRFALDQMRAGYGNVFPQTQSVRIATGDLPRVCICPHPVAEIGLGAFAGQDIERGSIVFVSTARLHLPEFLGMGVALKPHVSSSYAMFVSSNPNLDELSLFPERAADPWLFTNDARDDALYNIAPAPLFINGLPGVAFFCVKDVEKGQELFWYYLEGGFEQRVATSGVEARVLAQQEHPMVVGG